MTLWRQLRTETSTETVGYSNSAHDACYDFNANNCSTDYKTNKTYRKTI